MTKASVVTQATVMSIPTVINAASVMCATFVTVTLATDIATVV